MIYTCFLIILYVICFFIHFSLSFGRETAGFHFVGLMCLSRMSWHTAKFWCEMLYRCASCKKKLIVFILNTDIIYFEYLDDGRVFLYCIAGLYRCDIFSWWWVIFGYNYWSESQIWCLWAHQNSGIKHVFLLWWSIFMYEQRNIFFQEQYDAFCFDV